MLAAVSESSSQLGLFPVMAIIFSLGAIFAYAMQRFHLPTFLAFILTGMILGPNALNLVNLTELEALAQVGIIFLLFVVGLDLSVDKIKKLRYQAPLAGLLQLLFTTLALSMILHWAAGFPWQLAFLVGSILSLSSTAIVLKSMEESREIESDHGRLILGILIIQDLSIIPLMALVPSFTTPFHTNVAIDLAWVLGKALLFGSIAVAVSLKVVPHFLDRLASSNKREVFTLALVCISMGMALITHYFGLSYEAGAFVAGLALSQSLFCRQVIADSKAFRDVFITLFFVSMGLLFDITFLINHTGLIFLATIILIVTKALCAYGATRSLKFPNRTALWTGLSLFQVGEFSFVLLGRTLETIGKVPEWEKILGFWNPVLIDSIIISMFLTPLVLYQLHRVTAPYQNKRPGIRHAIQPLPNEDAPISFMTQKVIVGGFGPTARNLTLALADKNIPFTVVDTNLQTVRKLQAKGIHCVYGDLSRPEVQEEAGIHQSGVLAITFPDIRTAEAAVQTAKRLNPNIHCMVRSRYRVDVDRLHQIGVTSVVYEEFETSISFIFHVMNLLHFPIIETDRLIGNIRKLENINYQRPVSESHAVFGRFSLLEGTQIEWIEIHPSCKLAGKTLQEAEIRSKTGVNIIAVIQAKNQSQVHPDPQLNLRAHDVLVGVGSSTQLRALESLLYE